MVEKFSSEDFSTIVDHFHALKNAKERDFETLLRASFKTRLTIDLSNSPTIFLKFVMILTVMFHHAKVTLQSSSFHINLIVIATARESLGPEFSIETWPVADRCKCPLKDFVISCLYDEKHVLIPPFHYESNLKGALIEVLRGAYGVLPPLLQKNET
jgi:hypothetical protein